MIRSIVVVAILAAVVLGQRGQKERCEFIVHMDCRTFGLSDVCATDNRTYINHCDMAQAHCRDENLHQVHEGACGTPANATHVNGHEISFKIYCYAISRSDCTIGDDHEVLCGSDNVTYNNICSFEKAKCANVNLDVKSIGACK